MAYEVECPRLPSSINERTMPYTAQYFRLFGFKSGMISMWDSMGQYSTAEEVYKACIEKKCTWQELLDFKGYPENEVL